MKKIFGIIRKNYAKCWKFGKDTKWFFIFAFGIFALTFLIGFAFPVFFSDKIIEMLKVLALEVKGKSTFELVIFIFLNNLRASFMAMILGFVFGIFPLFTAIINGYLLGFVARMAVQTEGIFTMWKIFPHGIFELPAVLFSIGIGMKLGLKMTGIVSKKKGVGNLFVEALRFFVLVVLPLLIVAAIIEGTLIGLAG